MGYDAFWFIETRNQVKNLKRWFLWGILLFVFVSVCTVICVKSMYRETENYIIDIETPIVKVEEAKQTNANGYIKGTIFNNNETEMQVKYIKFAFYTKNDVNIGNEYIEVGTLRSKQTKTYELKFKYQNVDRFVITISDNKE